MGTARYAGSGTRGQEDTETAEHADTGTWGHGDTARVERAAPPRPLQPRAGRGQGGAARARGTGRRERARGKHRRVSARGAPVCGLGWGGNGDSGGTWERDSEYGGRLWAGRVRGGHETPQRAGEGARVPGAVCQGGGRGEWEGLRRGAACTECVEVCRGVQGMV